MTLSLNSPLAQPADLVTQPEDFVADQANELLRTSSYRGLRGVACQFRQGNLTLRGRVSSFYLKQVAQTLVRELEAVDRVDNRLEVGHSPR